MVGTIQEIKEYRRNRFRVKIMSLPSKTFEFQVPLRLSCLEASEYTFLKNRREVWTKDVSVSWSEE